MQAGSCSSNLTPSLGNSICCGCGPKKGRKGETGCRQILKWSPQPLYWSSCLYNTLPLSEDGTCDLLLTKRIWQWWLDMCDDIAYHCNSHLARTCPSLSALRRQGTVGKTHVARNLGRPPADSQKEMEAPSPTTHKEPNAANNHVSMDADPSPLEP